MDNLVEISTVVPNWSVPIVKLFSKHFFFKIGIDTQDKIEELIDNEKYDEAELEVIKARKIWGDSSFMVRLDTKISVIRCLGR